MVVQADAAVRTKVVFGIFQVYRSLAAWAQALAQTGQRRVIAELFAALRVGQLFSEFLALQVAV